MIDRSAFWKTFGPSVALGLKFVPEEGRALAPKGVGEGEKLACHKVAGMCRYDVEKASLRFGVAESLQRIEMGRRNVHSVRIPRRNWSLSPINSVVPRSRSPLPQAVRYHKAIENQPLELRDLRTIGTAIGDIPLVGQLIPLKCYREVLLDQLMQDRF